MHCSTTWRIFEILGQLKLFNRDLRIASHPFCKKAYGAKNRKEYDEQIIQYLVRMDALNSYTAYLHATQNYPEFENDEYDLDDDLEAETQMQQLPYVLQEWPHCS